MHICTLFCDLPTAMLFLFILHIWHLVLCECFGWHIVQSRQDIHENGRCCSYALLCLILVVLSVRVHECLCVFCAVKFTSSIFNEWRQFSKGSLYVNVSRQTHQVDQSMFCFGIYVVQL